MANIETYGEPNFFTLKKPIEPRTVNPSKFIIKEFFYECNGNNIKDIVTGLYDSLVMDIQKDTELGKGYETIHPDQQTIPSEALQIIQLPLDEAVTNAWKHTARKNPDKKVYLTAFVDIEGICLMVRSIGKHFNEEIASKHYKTSVADLHKQKQKGRMGLKIIERISTSAGIIYDETYAESCMYIPFSKPKEIKNTTEELAA